MDAREGLVYSPEVMCYEGEAALNGTPPCGSRHWPKSCFSRSYTHSPRVVSHRDGACRVEGGTGGGHRGGVSQCQWARSPAWSVSNRCCTSIVCSSGSICLDRGVHFRYRGSNATLAWIRKGSRICCWSPRPTYPTELEPLKDSQSTKPRSRTWSRCWSMAGIQESRSPPPWRPSSVRRSPSPNATSSTPSRSSPNAGWSNARLPGSTNAAASGKTANASSPLAST